MADERDLRGPGFVAGTWIRLADGQEWSFPTQPPEGADPDYEATLAAVFEAGDVAERLRAELALAILLISRHYDLRPEDYREILGYRAGDPALVEMQDAVHQLALVHAGRFQGKATLNLNPVTISATDWHPPSRSSRPARSRAPGQVRHRD